MLSGGGGTIQRTFALAAIEAGEVSAGEHGPHHAVGIDVEPAGRESLDLRGGSVPRNFVVFGQSRMRGVGAGNQMNNPTGKAQNRSPDGPVLGADGHAVKPDIEALVLGGIDRLVRLDIRIALAVAIGVENDRRPSLRLFFVMG